tara:strand:+ start:310 stop:1818 length:1509 start_codon:yes stop_codon:yes gene_type:complete
MLGMVTSFSLPPFNYFIINFFTFSLFFLFLIKKSELHNNKKLFFFYGWLFGFGYFLISLYWISISLTFDETFKVLIPLTVCLIPAFLAIFYGLISYFFITFKKNNILGSFFIFSLIFGSLEFLRGSILTGFPWNLIVFSFSNQIELLAVTSIIGTYGLNLLCISIFISPALLILEDSKKKKIKVFIFIIIIILSILIFGSHYKDRFHKAATEVYDFKIRIIGSNINLNRFYSNIDPVSIIEELIEISNPKKNEKTIFVWPEGILPGISQSEFEEYRFLFEEKFSKNHLLIIGTNSHSIIQGSKNYFNSLTVYDHKLKLLNSYNKIKLVPFGEFLPLEGVLKKIGLRSLTNNYQSFSKGHLRQIIEVKLQNISLKILPLICYEIIYSGNLFDNQNFDFIINISEDGWFGDSIGPKQHFAHSILRAVENGKYVLRSANNGNAAIINPLGIIEKNVSSEFSGYVDFYERKNIKPTIFSKYGNKIFVLLILLYIFLIFSFNRSTNE